MTIKTIAIFNHKGGVGKTTTTVNLGACLALSHHQRVLVIDLDPQANATRALLPTDLPEEQPTVKDWLLGFEHSAPVTRSSVEKLELVPADLSLSEVAFGIAQRPGRDTLLRTALASLTDGCDFVLIDCPPSLGPLALNALAAADAVIVPCETQYLSLRGLSHVFDLVRLVQDKLNPSLHVLGVLPTKFHVLSLANHETLRYMRQAGKFHVFNAVIPRDVKAEEAPSHGQPLIIYAPDSRAAKAYNELASEVSTLCRN